MAWAFAGEASPRPPTMTPTSTAARPASARSGRRRVLTPAIMPTPRATASSGRWFIEASWALVRHGVTDRRGGRCLQGAPYRRFQPDTVPRPASGDLTGDQRRQHPGQIIRHIALLVVAGFLVAFPRTRLSLDSRPLDENAAAA